MKTTPISFLRLIAVSAIICMLWSCNKENASPPAAQVTSPDEVLQAGEVAAAQVTPGTYRVLRFIDTGDDETPQFNGYTFVFRANGDLVATTNRGAVFTGRWRLNSAQTRMDISISGTRALDDLDDDDWRVVTLTNQRISLRKPGPDRIVFVMQ